RRERPEPLAELDLDVHVGLHLRAAGIAEDAATPERARTELHPSVEPADDLAVGQLRGHLRGQLGARQLHILGVDRVERLFDLAVRVLGAKVRALHAVLARYHRARLAAVTMPDQLRDAEGAARVAR